MASSNRHWPSLFKSKPCSTHHQWQHDINHPSPLHSGPCAQKPSYSSGGATPMSGPGCEERTPEPKPRWNPKPEQIRILEAIFNSGMVNPPRDEIRRIRAQLQEYGQVGDANVFYWFQNRKSRSKHKQRQLQSVASAGRAHSRSNATAPANLAMTNGPAAPASSSSSSSDRSSGSEKTTPPASAVALSGLIDISASPTASVNQTLFQTPAGLCAEPFLFQAPPQGHYLSELMGIIGMPEQPASVVSTGLLWSELMGQESRSKMQLHQSYAGVNVTSAAATTSATATATDISSVTAAAAAAASASADTIASPVNEMHGLGGIGVGIGVTTPARLTVFINEVAFEVMAAPLNVREAFGEEAVLLHSSGHPVLTDEWGITLQPLQNGASYYLV